MSRGTVVSTTVPSVMILGADAVLAALPATPVQLAHACHRLGFVSVFPASWGDELIAGACLDQLDGRGDEPAVLCSCPLVRDRLLRAGDDLIPWMISLVAPPVAVARYLRSAYGARTLHITYAGSCPGAADPSIDARLTPPELLALCRERNVSPAAQPQLFESIIPPDRRRSLSMPGGAPSDDALRQRRAGRTVAELSAEDPLAELADRLIAREKVLIDLAPHIGCACSGRGGAGSRHDERRDLIALEPPRSRDPVIDTSVEVDLIVPLPHDAPLPLPKVAQPGIGAPAARGSAGVAVPTERPAIVPPLPELPHAVILEYLHGPAARRALTVTRRRESGEVPGALLGEAQVPRAYLAKRPRRQPVRRVTPAPLADAPPSRGERARFVEQEMDLADTRRPRRSTRPIVFPIHAEPPQLPPPPGKRKPDTILGITAIIGLALSIATAGGLQG